MLKSSAETEKNSSKLVLPIFFTILYISLALLLVSVTQTSCGTSDENGFSGGHGHVTWMDVCDREDSALNIAHYWKLILTKFYTVKQTGVFAIKVTKWSLNLENIVKLEDGKYEIGERAKQTTNVIQNSWYHSRPRELLT